MVREHRAHDDRKGAQGRDEDGGGEGVRRKIGNLRFKERGGRRRERVRVERSGDQYMPFFVVPDHQKHQQRRELAGWL